MQGARTVTARDFERDPDVEILTPDVVVATLDRDGNLEMEVCVEQGRGYQPAEKREPEALPINAMLIGADFSPVKRVNFHVERLAPPSASQERLILEVWTTGGVTPETAVADASRILAGQFALLIDFAASPPAESGEAAPPVRSAVHEHLFQSVAELELSVRALQLSEDRQDRHHRRPGAEDRVRAAQDRELRQEVAERDQDLLGEMGLSLGMRLDPRGAGAAACRPRAHDRGPRVISTSLTLGVVDRDQRVHPDNGRTRAVDCELQRPVLRRDPEGTRSLSAPKCSRSPGLRTGSGVR